MNTCRADWAIAVVIDGRRPLKGEFAIGIVHRGIAHDVRVSHKPWLVALRLAAHAKKGMMLNVPRPQRHATEMQISRLRATIRKALGGELDSDAWVRSAGSGCYYLCRECEVRVKSSIVDLEEFIPSALLQLLLTHAEPGEPRRDAPAANPARPDPSPS